MSFVLSNQLMHFRKMKGLSQTDLAVQSGVSPSTIYNIEAQKHLTAHGKTLRKLADALDCSVADLYGETSQQVQPLRECLRCNGTGYVREGE